jgi:hypothetical protein
MARLRAGQQDAVAGLVLALAWLAAYVPHFDRGGFYSDDWSFAAIYEDGARDGFSGGLSALLDVSSSRPVGTLYAAVRYDLFGNDPTGHMVVAGLLWLLVVLLFFALLRLLRLPPLHAGGIALLALLFPLADSTRLWPAASALNLGIALYLAGTLVALAGLGRTGPRSAAMHAVAVALYVASVLTYEVTIVAVLLSFALYRSRADWRRALVRWGVDVGAIAAVLLLATTQSTVEREPITALPSRVGEVTAGALSVVSWAVVPLGDTNHLSAARVLGGLLVLVVVAAALRFAVDGERAAAVRRWLAVAAGGVVATVAGYVVLLPVMGYNPAHRGIANRLNVFSSLGISALVFSLAMLAAILLVWKRGPRATTAVGVGLAAVLAAGYAVRLRSDEGHWHDAAVDQRRVLDTIRGSPRLPADDRFVAFQVPAFTAPGVPVFHETWDLTGALQLLWGDYSLQAYPANNGRVVVCRRAGPYVLGGTATRLAYGRTRFFGARTGRSRRIGSRGDCERSMRVVLGSGRRG